LEFFFNSEAFGEKARLLAAFEQFARENRLPEEMRKAADLALEEALTNVITYGFADSKPHIVAIDFVVRGGEFVIEIRDDGTAFDPTKHPAPDLNVPADKRKIGGLGIHMIRTSMDAVEYQRAGGRNILRMRKRIKG
jgi:anti-sigma regulatory factor (Ser/Thr protein kinase)